MKDEKHFAGNISRKALPLALLLLLIIYLQTLPSLFSNWAGRSGAGRPPGTPDFRIALDGWESIPVPATGDSLITGQREPETPVVTLAAKAPDDRVQGVITYEQSAFPRHAQSASTGYDPKKETPTYTKPRVSTGISTGAAFLANAAAFLVPNPDAVMGGRFGVVGSAVGGGGGSISSRGNLAPLPVVSP